MTQEQREKNTAILEWFDALIFALALVLVILLFVFRTVNVDGESMVPTLQNGEQLIVRSILYEPSKGDIVVVDGHTHYGKPLVKRVIAMQGDTVHIDFDTHEVFVNGQLLDESAYIAEPTARSFDTEFPVVVPEGSLFLMGDNRNNSLDSRDSSIGMIDRRDILGEAVFRILPVGKFGVIG